MSGGRGVIWRLQKQNPQLSPPDGGAAERDLQTWSREDDLQLFNLSRLAAQSKHGLPARLPLVSRLSPSPLQRDRGEVLHSDSLAGGELTRMFTGRFLLPRTPVRALFHLPAKALGIHMGDGLQGFSLVLLMGHACPLHGHVQACMFTCTVK